MKYLVDAHHVGGRATGNETWAIATTTAMQSRAKSDGDELLLAASHGLPPEMVRSSRTEFVNASSFRRLAWELPRIARQHDVDAVLVQYTAPLTTKPTVVAIHDLSFTESASASWIPPRERTRMNATIRWSATRAAKVVALSEYTARDLATKWGVPQEKIVVVYPAVSPAFRQLLHNAEERKHGAEPDPWRVLIVGNVVPRKNHLLVVKAISRLRHKGLPISLRIAGQVPPSAMSLQNEILTIGNGWTDITGYLSDQDLVDEYRAASVLCYPSFYEGFGIPVLEAMQAGLPVLVSDATALPEAAGDAGQVLSAVDVDVWSDALERVLTDAELARSMRERGLAHVAKFEWSKAGSLLLDTLREAAKR